MIDAHCHLEHMPPEVISEARERGMKAIITSIADIKDADGVISLHKRHPDFVFACLGFHPEIMTKYSDADIDRYIDFLRAHKQYMAAVGEVGLDYNWTAAEERERSKGIFLKFIDLSREMHLPLVIHSRNGREGDGIGDAINMLIENNCTRVMMHCFSGNDAQLKRCLDSGWMISYATVICKSPKHQRLAKETPLESTLLETDAPWLDPDSKELTNRPWKIERSAELIAQLKNIKKEDVLFATDENAKKFFGLVL